MDETSLNLQQKLQRALKIIKIYEQLINSYILDFYVEDHWNKLPQCWRNHLEFAKPEALTDLLYTGHDEESRTITATIWPLSLLTLKVLLKELSIDRRPIQKSETASAVLVDHPKLRNVFTKCVKPKKCHEIERMALICKQICDKSDVDFLIDFGAGQGHLARILGYGYGIKVCCVEMQNEFNIQANLIDQHLEKIAGKHLTPEERQHFQSPVHLTLRLAASMQPEEFLESIKQKLNISNNNFGFGIIGLHPCGDLGAILMRMLLNCKQARFLNYVGCCYMKLSTRSTIVNSEIAANLYGYPLSKFLHSKCIESTRLSYEALEIACHAIEMYKERLKSVNYEYLKVHSYRAASERIITKRWPELKHIGLRSVKCTDGLAFEDYFYKAVQSLPAVNLDASELKTAEVLNDLKHWKRVVIFYTLRLMFAPLIESVILYDRVLFLTENDCDVQINAIFDPALSPRNHVTSAIKSS